MYKKKNIFLVKENTINMKLNNRYQEQKPSYLNKLKQRF